MSRLTFLIIPVHDQKEDCSDYNWYLLLSFNSLNLCIHLVTGDMSAISRFRIHGIMSMAVCQNVYVGIDFFRFREHDLEGTCMTEHLTSNACALSRC